MATETRRREFLQAGVISVAASTSSVPLPAAVGQSPRESSTDGAGKFWPNGARLVISISMQMEAGAQPQSGAESPLPKIDPKYPDIAATKWYEYGFKEGPPRLLDMLDHRNVKVTSHIVGAAVEKHSALAKKIVSVATSPRPTGRRGRRSIPWCRKRSEELR
jgi:hypothetical protein